MKVAVFTSESSTEELDTLEDGKLLFILERPLLLPGTLARVVFDGRSSDLGEHTSSLRQTLRLCGSPDIPVFVVPEKMEGVRLLRHFGVRGDPAVPGDVGDIVALVFEKKGTEYHLQPGSEVVSVDNPILAFAVCDEKAIVNFVAKHNPSMSGVANLNIQELAASRPKNTSTYCVVVDYHNHYFTGGKPPLPVMAANFRHLSEYCGLARRLVLDRDDVILLSKAVRSDLPSPPSVFLSETQEWKRGAAAVHFLLSLLPDGEAPAIKADKSLEKFVNKLLLVPQDQPAFPNLDTVGLQDKTNLVVGSASFPKSTKRAKLRGLKAAGAVLLQAGVLDPLHWAGVHKVQAQHWHRCATLALGSTKDIEVMYEFLCSYRPLADSDDPESVVPLDSVFEYARALGEKHSALDRVNHLQRHSQWTPEELSARNAEGNYPTRVSKLVYREPVKDMLGLWHPVASFNGALLTDEDTDRVRRDHARHITYPCVDTSLWPSLFNLAGLRQQGVITEDHLMGSRNAHNFKMGIEDASTIVSERCPLTQGVAEYGTAFWATLTAKQGGAVFPSLNSKSEFAVWNMFTETTPNLVESVKLFRSLEESKLVKTNKSLFYWASRTPADTWEDAVEKKRLAAERQLRKMLPLARKDEATYRRLEIDANDVLVYGHELLRMHALTHLPQRFSTCSFYPDLRRVCTQKAKSLSRLSESILASHGLLQPVCAWHVAFSELVGKSVEDFEAGLKWKIKQGVSAMERKVAFDEAKRKRAIPEPKGAAQTKLALFGIKGTDDARVKAEVTRLKDLGYDQVRAVLHKEGEEAAGPANVERAEEMYPLLVNESSDGNFTPLGHFSDDYLELAADWSKEAAANSESADSGAGKENAEL